MMLNLQMDNCWRENKNSYLFAFLAWLVERKVFRRIYVSFLPVGHTHFCCDQVASRISVAVRHNEFYTRPEFHNLIRCCSFPRPSVERVEHVADMKTLFNPNSSKTYVGSVIDQPHGLTKPLHFRIQLDSDGCPIIRVKENSAVEHWYGAYHIFRREDSAGKVVHSSGLDLSEVGPSVFKEVDPEKLKKIKKNLLRCAGRSGVDAHKAQMKDFESLRGVPIPFHWVNGGRYRLEREGKLRQTTEAELLAERLEEPEPTLPLRVSRVGLYSTRAKRLRNADPTEGLALGMFVVVDARDDASTGLDWYVGRVINFDISDPKVVTLLR